MITLGFDTSNYTTSVAAFSDGKLINIRKLLPVPEGGRGLRQSDALFHHVKQLPDLFSRLSAQIDMSCVRAVCASSRPRNVEGSYMPVFLAGTGYARVCADSLGVPYFECSHQDGHIMAAVESGGFSELLDEPFICVHLSGGTTEILLSEYCGGAFKNTIVGGTKDISAGQFIDRTGVHMGMKFPCGKELEQLALTAEKPVKLPISAKDGYMNFSGAETKVSRIIGDYTHNELALGVLTSIAGALAAALDFVCSQNGINKILLAGGVASNGIIKRCLNEQLNRSLYFAPREFASDNACGVAVLAAEMLEEL